MLTVHQDQDNGSTFRQALRGALQDTADCHVYICNEGTANKKPTVMIKFHVMLPNGIFKECQKVLTGRELMAIAEALHAVDPTLCTRMFPEKPPGTVIQGSHNGVDWEALLIEKLYLIKCSGANEVSMAFHEGEVVAVAHAHVERAAGKMNLSMGKTSQ